jgi:pyruvate-formate lyase-activating enzyme
MWEPLVYDRSCIKFLGRMIVLAPREVSGMDSNELGAPNCFQPWYELNVMYNRRVSSCCYYNGPASGLDFDRYPDMFAYWNGDFFRKLRNEVDAKQPHDSGCKGCVLYTYWSHEEIHGHLGGLESPDHHTPIQVENRRRAVQNFMERKIIVDHVPLRFYFNFGVTCNINCVMCCQTVERPSKMTLDAERLLTWKPYYIRGEMLSIIGGEPLAMPESIKFIRAVLKDPDFATVTLSLHTNGLNLDKFLPELEGKDHVAVCVSLDSVGSVYEKIRVGSNWEKVSSNMLAYKERAAKKGLHWGLSTANIVMKSSLANIDELAKWHVENDIIPNFVNFMNFPGIEDTYFQENIFAYPDLLAEVPDWNFKLDNAVKLFQKKGWITTANLLRKMKLELLTCIFNPNIAVSGT